MPIPFATDDWIKSLKDELNHSPTYREAARDWEGDFCFVVHNGGPSSTYLYMDLWHGECRDAYVMADPVAKSPEFVIEAPVVMWRRVIEKKMDPIQGLIMRQLKLKGPMLKVVKAPKAATELVHCCTLIDTLWPDS